MKVYLQQITIDDDRKRNENKKNTKLRSCGHIDSVNVPAFVLHSVRDEHWWCLKHRQRRRNIETHRRICFFFFLHTKALSHTTDLYANAYAPSAWPRYVLHFLLNYCNGIERKKHTSIQCRRLCHLLISFHLNMLSKNVCSNNNNK